MCYNACIIGLNTIRRGYARASNKTKNDANINHFCHFVFPQYVNIIGKAKNNPKKAPNATNVIGYNQPNFITSIKKAFPTHEKPKAK